MGQDNPFLQTILDNPADDAPRLIYADWLEEHGESRQAEFLRLECRLARWTLTDEERASLTRAFHRCGGLIDPDWIARLGIRTIYAERTSTPFWSLRETVEVTATTPLRQAGGRGSYAAVTFRFSPLKEKTAIILEIKTRWLPRFEYASGVVTGVREGIRTHSLSGKVLGSLRMEWIEARDHPFDSSQSSFHRAAVLALTHPNFVGKLMQVAQW